MSFQEQSLWAATAPELESFKDRPLPERADIVVIGGGYTGLSAALELARNGARVTVLERETIGWGASRTGWKRATPLWLSASTV